MPNVSIERMTNSDPQFYGVMGQYIARRDIVGELGAPIWDDDDKLWFVAFGQHGVAGFAAARIDGAVVKLSSAYVMPGARRSGVYSALIEARIDWARGAAVVAVATPASAPILARRGFVKTRSKGRFAVMILEATA